MSLKKRGLSLLLAMVMAIGLVPTTMFSALAASPPAGVPATLSYGGRKFGVSYDSPNWKKRGWVENFTVKDGNGNNYTGFCMDHTKGPPKAGVTWSYQWTKTSDEMPSAFALDWWHYYNDISEKMDEMHPELNTTKEADEIKMREYALAEGYDTYWSVWTREVNNCIPQAACWLWLDGRLTGSPDDEQLRRLGDERNAMLGEYNKAFVATSDEALEFIKGLYQNWMNGKYPHGTYHCYNASATAVQPLLIREKDPTETEEPQKGWIKLLKTDLTETGLAGAEFTVYEDNQCTVVALDEQSREAKIITGSDGYGAVQVAWKGSSTRTFYVKETVAPAGCKIKNDVFSVQVNGITNYNEQNAALVKGGAPIKNGMPQEPEGIVQKKDANTGEGVGPATFHFEGQAENGEVINRDIDCDETGALELQWTDPHKEKYMPPGQYTVTEIIPPQGYEKTDESKHLILRIIHDPDSDTDIASSNGPIVFQNYQKHKITIEKRSQDAKPLAGAEFDVYQNGNKLTHLTTGADGTAVFDGTDGDGIESGYYTFFETNPPPGYLPPYIAHQSVYVNAEDISVTNHVLSFINYTDTEIIIKKVSRNTESPLAGAVFEVRVDDTSIGEFGPTDASGTIVINPSIYGRFLNPNQESWTISVRETVPPDGYLLDDSGWHTVEVKRGQKVEPFVFTDTKYPEVLVVKKDRESQERLEGTTFEVTVNAGAKFSLTKSTNKNGEVRITYDDYRQFLGELNLDEWTVTVRELTPTDKYNKDKQQESGDYTVTKALAKGQSLLEFEFKDTHYRSIRVTKKDAQTDWLLAGAEFTLHCVKADDPKAGGNISDRILTTDGTGTVLFEDVPNGTYELWESGAPAGYDVNKERKRIVVTSDSDPIIEFEFKNEPKSGLLLRKIDAVTKQPIPGVCFRVERLGNGAVVDSKEYHTDTNGVVVIENATEGWYRIAEVTTVDGYILDKEAKEIYVDNQHDAYTVTFENKQTHMLNILKRDAITGKPLPGATFEIRSAGGSHVANVVTGVNGYANLPNLKPGSYVVKEIKAPTGHLIDPYPQTFEVKEDDAGRVYTLIFDNSPTTKLYIMKRDAQTGLPLAGAEFKVSYSSGEIIADRVVTDENGIAMITNDKMGEGTYFVQEIKAPTGYILDDSVHTVFIHDGEVKTLTLFNEQPGGLTILKVDAETNQVLSGAEFKLFTLDYRLLGTYSTGADGYIRIKDLEPGYYFIQETDAPDGYLVDSEYKRVEIKAFEVTTLTWPNSQKASMTIRKVDKETKQPLAGAGFEVRTMDGTLVKTVETDSSGVAMVAGLDDGYYKVKETAAPEGYLLNEETYTVKITRNEPATITVEDQAKKGVIIRKLDADDRKPLANAVFEILNLNGKLIGEYVTDGSGTITTREIEPGYYYLVETKAPDGYVLEDKRQMFQVEEDGVTTLTVTNRKETTIQVYKTDSVTGKPLAAAQFEVKDHTGMVLGYIETDATGWGYSAKLEPGNYTITETRSPSGYVLDRAVYKVALEKGKSAIVRVTNTPGMTLQITKVDKDTRALLAGASFEVRYDRGHGDCTYIGTYTTDPTGMVTTEPLEPGFYMVKEVVAPDGYALNEEEFRYCVKAGQSNTLIVEDQALATLTIRKIDSVTKKPIPGAVFKVETADHSLIGLFESDANGDAIATGLKAGVYIVTETQAPEGYQVATAPQTVVVEYSKNNYLDFVDAENASLIITLQDKMTGKYLADGHFTVTWCYDNTIIYEGVTDVTGSIVVGNLKPGKYIITQTYGPDGYYLTETEINIQIPADTQQTVHFFNITAGLVIEKVDRLTKETLEGARFQVTRNEDNYVVGEYVTDKDGLALVSGLKPGMYTVEELVAPAGYTIDEGPKLVHVKETGEAHVTFTDTPLAGITIKVVDKDNRTPLAGVMIEVWRQNGNLVNSYTTDTTGTIMTDKLQPGFYVVKLISVTEGYTAIASETTVEVVDGEAVTYTFECVASGSLTIASVDQSGKAIAGMKITLTTIDGAFVGNYITDSNGFVAISNLTAGHYIVTEKEAPAGFNIVSASQNVKVVSNQSTKVTFEHTKTFGLQIRTTCFQTNAVVQGAVYEVTQLNGAKVGTYTSDAAGLIYVSLTPGHYIVTPISAPQGYIITDGAARTVEVKANEVTVTEFTVKQLSSIRVKIIDGTSQKGLYGVRVLLKSGGTCVKEYSTNNEGYITLVEDILNGGYTLEMISVPAGYQVDTIPKSISVLNGETTEIVWKLYKDAGQIQVVVTSLDYNKSRDLAAGTLLQGATFEVMNADTYQVVCQMISDASGIAASSGLPIGRYIVKQVGAAPYYGISDKETEVRLKINNDVVRVEYQNASVTVGVEVAQKSNQSIRAGSSMRFDVTKLGSKADVRLDNFYFHIKVPTDAARISTISTGTWNYAVWYSISYKTNMQDYRLLSDKLLSTSKYEFDLSTQALGLQLGEYVTDIRYEFGTVPAGFSLATQGAYMLYVLNTIPNGYKLISRIEAGGQYNTVAVSTNGNVGANGTDFTGAHVSGNSGQWVSDTALWTVTVKGNTMLPNRLPKTGY